jgi:hypothetical protein
MQVDADRIHPRASFDPDFTCARGIAPRAPER